MTEAQSAHEEPDREELVRLAEDLQAAIASDEIGRAIEAHQALGERLEQVDSTVVIDLATERARRRGRQA